MVIRDITEIKAIKEALSESEDRYRTLVENAVDAFFLHDLDGRIIDVNQRACETLGYSRQELLGLSIADFELTCEPEQIEKSWLELIPDAPVTRDGVHRRKDGSTFPVEVCLGRFDSRHGPLILASARDVTERKHLEEQLLRSQRLEAIGRLAGGVAHDFNNMLTAIIGYAHLGIRRLSNGDPLRRDFDEILRAANRSVELTRKLLAFSRRQITQPRVINMRELLLELDGMLRRVMGEHIELVMLITEDLGSVKVDPGQMEQVMANLVINARDAMPNGGKITIETKNVILDSTYAAQHPDASAGEHVMLAVTDTGIGMTDEVKQHLFEPFFTTKAPGEGTGLGLSTCYGIVAQNQGHITVWRETARGTTFKVYLPRINDESTTSRPRIEADEFPRGDETVFLVEDEPALRQVASEVLRDLGYTVLEGRNGEDALRLLQERTSEEIDLLVTDVVMPLMGGKELADRLWETRPNLKVIFTSGYNGEAVADSNLDTRGTAFVEKPFTPASLARKVREVLDS